MRRAPGCFRFQTLTQIQFSTTFPPDLGQGSLAGMRFIILLLVSGSSLALSQLSVPSPYEPTCCAAGSATGACNWNTCATASCSATGQYSCTTCSQQNGLAYCPPPPGPPTPGTTCFRTGARCDSCFGLHALGTLALRDELLHVSPADQQLQVSARPAGVPLITDDTSIVETFSVIDLKKIERMVICTPEKPSPLV
jgi:hypothetical protein